MRLQTSLGGWNHFGSTRVNAQGHPQCSPKGLEYGLDLMVGIHTPNIINMQSHARMIDKSAEELNAQVDIEVADTCPCKGYIELQTRST